MMADSPEGKPGHNKHTEEGLKALLFFYAPLLHYFKSVKTSPCGAFFYPPPWNLGRGGLKSRHRGYSFIRVGSWETLAWSSCHGWMDPLTLPYKGKGAIWSNLKPREGLPKAEKPSTL